MTTLNLLLLRTVFHDVLLFKGPEKIFPQTTSYFQHWAPASTQHFLPKLEQSCIFLCFCLCSFDWFEVGGTLLLDIVMSQICSFVELFVARETMLSIK